MRAAHVLFLLATAAAASSAAVDPVYEHVRRLMNFRCSEPQQRAVPATQVVDRRLQTNQTLWPPVTVLRRCDGGSGCCLGNVANTCTAVATHNVTLYFDLVTPGGPGGRVKKEVINVEVQEDAACDCRPRAEPDAH
ncbi:hypothetical protein R5R35_005766 [Gryllus longicercus]|uniref:Platelet-derived growth factor (PDGF) family profile domain-containing protein n=1 Tax=Gryllus longicercus TaxID=2509291 RepID=A0AAN9VY58_9ORTH